MTGRTQTILGEALRLNPVERAEIIDELLHSFDKRPDARVDARWVEEVESRVDTYDTGRIESDSAEVVFERISKR